MSSLIEDELRAGYPVLYLHTFEPQDVYAKCRTDFKDFSEWNCAFGITEYVNGTVNSHSDTSPAAFVQWLANRSNSVLLAHNLHFFISDPEIIQHIITGSNLWKRTGNTLAIVSPVVNIPPELSKLVHLIELPLPDVDALQAIQDDLGRSYGIAPDSVAVLAAKGLTAFEAETAFALSLVKTSSFDPQVVTAVKGQMIRKSGKIQFWPPTSMDEVGGLDLLKAWLEARRAALLPDSNVIYRPRGILIVGIPGTGKSLISKAIASVFRRPLLNLNLSALKGSLVGESEQNITEACKLIKAFGPCVVWCDEIEKALGSAKASHSTGDTSGSMLGILLTEMQENLENAFFAVTANAIEMLPSEFIRRFDAVFFVDTPNVDERRQILSIMNRKYTTAIDLAWAEKLESYTGSEIEQFVKDSLFDGEEAAFSAIVPLARTMREQINELRTWAAGRARPANRRVAPTQTAARTLTVGSSAFCDTLTK